MPVIVDVPRSEGHLALCGMRLERLLSAELFRELVGWQLGGFGSDPAALCHERWTDLAAAIVALPKPAEGMLVFGITSSGPDADREVVVAFLAVGRGADAAQARAGASAALADLRTLFVTTLDYAEIKMIEDEALLSRLLLALTAERVIEFRRRHDPLRLSLGVVAEPIQGFRAPAEGAGRVEPGNSDVSLTSLFPWVPSNDPWRRLLEALLGEKVPCSLVVHFRGFDRVPEACHTSALSDLAAAEQMAVKPVEDELGLRAVMLDMTEALRHDALRRVAFTQNGMLAARVFLVTTSDPSSALIATIRQALDDVSVRPDQMGAQSLFRGGATVAEVEHNALFASLAAPTLDQLFGAQEASAVLRTPMPVDIDLPGLTTNRARTAAIVGRSGQDCPLGINVHRDIYKPAALDTLDRFRHCYVVGQTGTGKSTLLLSMILHDIRQGRGVGVLDPHGTLIEDLLQRMPAERAADVVIVDTTDSENPVGFNLLRIEESDPVRYRRHCDLIIDDLFAYIENTYLKEHVGPIFESHFRNMLALLMGSEPQRSPLIPNLMVFRLMYTNRQLRDLFCRRAKGRDPVLDDFMAEAVATSGEGSLMNLAPYVTSKFNRFVSDVALRNITCQNRILDLSEIVNGGKILLFYLGKGRFGDYAAGLLASQIVSRIRNEVMKRGTGPGIRPFFLYADEFHIFADHRFGELLAEARKFGLSLTIAHQYVRQLAPEVCEAILGNVGTIVSFRVGAADAEILEPLVVPTFSKRDLMSLPNFRAYVKSAGALGQTPFSIETPPVAPGTDSTIAERIRESSRRRHGRAREEVEAEIMETYRAYTEFHA